MALVQHQCDSGWVLLEDGTVRRCLECNPRLQVAHARSTDPVTSHEAAASVKVKVSESFVLACMKDIGKPVSDEELVSYIRSTYPEHKIADSRIRTARNKLTTEHHLVRWAGRGRTSRDKACNIWEAAPLG